MAQLGADVQHQEQGYENTPEMQQGFDDMKTRPSDASQDSQFEKPGEELDSSSGNQSIPSQAGIGELGDENGTGGASQSDQLRSADGNDGLGTKYEESPSSQLDMNPDNREPDQTPSRVDTNTDIREPDQTAPSQVDTNPDNREPDQTAPSQVDTNPDNREPDQAPPSQVDTNPDNRVPDQTPSSQVETNPDNRATEGTPSAGGADGFQPGREAYGEQQRSYGTADPNTQSLVAGFGSSSPNGSEQYSSAPPNQGSTQSTDRAQQFQTSAQQGGFPVPTRPPGAVVPSDNQFSGPRQGEAQPGNNQQVGVGEHPSQTTVSEGPNYGESVPEYNQQVGVGGLPSQTNGSQDPNYGESAPGNNQQIGEGGLPAQTKDSQGSTYQLQSEPANTGQGDVPPGVHEQSSNGENRTENFEQDQSTSTRQGQSKDDPTYTLDPSDQNQPGEAAPISEDTTGGTAVDETPEKRGLLTKLKHMWPGVKQHDVYGISTPTAATADGDGKSPSLATKLKEKLIPSHGKNKDESVGTIE